MKERILDGIKEAIRMIEEGETGKIKGWSQEYTKEITEVIRKKAVYDETIKDQIDCSDDGFAFPPEVLNEIFIEAAHILINKYSPKTFAIPSHDVMFTLLALFSGKPDKIPRKLLAKPFSERTPEEQKEADDFLDAIIRKDTDTSYDDDGKEVKTEEVIAIIADNPRVKADAKIEYSLFAMDERVQEEALAVFIKRTYGPLGLRHLLALIIGLEDGGRTGTFQWNINEHLARLGLNKKQGGAYDPEEKRTATEIVRIFTSLIITATLTNKKTGKETIKGQRLFSIDGFQVDKFQNEIVNEVIELRATDFWYRNAFHPPEGGAPKYTKLLREVARENHRIHALTIYLTPLLAIWWRMDPERKLSIKSIMEWCDINYSHKNPHRMRDLKNLEAELKYMEGKGYLGSWSHDGEGDLPSSCKDPFNCNLTLTPPAWLKDEIEAIKEKKERATAIAKTPSMSVDEFNQIFLQTGLSRSQFATNLGITPQMVSSIRNGKRKITKEMALNVRETFGNR